ncbi:hypothetical protein [Microbulbifer epialgicus]|uniref:Uncharacterized protein n=1 Tax=Microbulbifer epialgicus TaxID=393907 RepID=A0ABV4P709_9GAMM
MILGAVTVFLILVFSFVNIQQGGRNLDQLLKEVSASAEIDAQNEINSGDFDFLAEAYGFGDSGRRVPGIGFEKYNKCVKEVAS